MEEIIGSVLKVMGKRFSNIGEISQSDYEDHYFKRLIVTAGSTFQVGDFGRDSYNLFKTWRTEYQTDPEKENR